VPAFIISMVIISDILYSKGKSYDYYEDEDEEYDEENVRELGKKLNKKLKVVYSKKVRKNDSCPCGSGKKYKNCCGK
jgi:uncharacterized protein YecA (UPF0149 family)